MSIGDELARLEELHRRGALSDDEYARAKARALDDAAPARPAPAAAAAINQLRRSRDDRWLGGVCGGLVRTTGVAAWVWRLVFALLVLCGGTGVLVYLLLWIFVPQEDAGLGGDSHGQAPAR